MKPFHITPLDNYSLKARIQLKIDRKTKPLGSLGQLERLALQIGMIQDSESPQLIKPVMLTVAADHEIINEGFGSAPACVTWQQCLNFLNGGGAIGMLCAEYGLDLRVVDAGVNYDFPDHPKLIKAKVRKGTRNFLHEHAMTHEECLKAINNGRRIVADVAQEGTNVVGFGEMGIGNTSPASTLLAAYTGFDIARCTGPGAGITDAALQHKTDTLRDAMHKHGVSDDPIENLARFGGLEIATIAGGMLEAAAQRMVILVDGFITTAGFLAAYKINPLVRDYAIFSHSSHEPGHVKMLNYVDAEPVLNLSLRLGEGSGAAIAYPVITGCVAMLNKMTSFDEAGVFNVSEAS